MSLTDAEKQAKAERKAAKKAAKAAAKVVETPQATSDESKKRKAESIEVVEGNKAKKAKSESNGDAVVAAQEDDDQAAAKAAKKARKEAKKLAKAALNGQSGSATATDASAIAAPVASASSSEIEAFLSEHDISYDPPAAATSTYPPVLSFDALSISEGLKQGLKSFSKPTPVQSSAWGVLFRSKDCIAIAETGYVEHCLLHPCTHNIIDLVKPWHSVFQQSNTLNPYQHPKRKKQAASQSWSSHPLENLPCKHTTSSLPLVNLFTSIRSASTAAYRKTLKNKCSLNQTRASWSVHQVESLIYATKAP